MNVLGHAGITIAAVYSAEHLFQMWRHGRVLGLRAPSRFPPGPPGTGHCDALRPIDYRLVVVGALLPDIIDKPLAFWLAPSLVNQSIQSIGHSLAFGLLLLAVSLTMLRLWDHRGLLVIAVGSAGHLLLDQMWQFNEVFLWPVQGLAFPHGTTTLSEWWTFNVPHMPKSLPEILGGIALLAFAIGLYRRKSVLHFVRWGTIR